MPSAIISLSAPAPFPHTDHTTTTYRYHTTTDYHIVRTDSTTVIYNRVLSYRNSRASEQYCPLCSAWGRYLCNFIRLELYAG